jgi:hypothetical protein
LLLKELRFRILSLRIIMRLIYKDEVPATKLLNFQRIEGVSIVISSFC